MLRPGFVEEWNSLDALAAGFAKELLAKENATPSVSYKLFLSYDPEAILWLGFTSKDEAVKERFNLFLKVWPEVRQRIPHALMQEMRITAELPAYSEIVRSLFLELLDGKLAAIEELRAFLEPYSPPAPPPKETIKRPRAKRGEAKIKDDSFDEDEEDSEDDLEDEEDLDDIGGEDEDLDLGMHLPKVDLEIDSMEESDSAAGEDDEEDEEERPKPAPKAESAKRASKPPAESKVAKAAPQTAKSAAAPSTQKPAEGAKAVHGPLQNRQASQRPSRQWPRPCLLQPKSRFRPPRRRASPRLRPRLRQNPRRRPRRFLRPRKRSLLALRSTRLGKPASPPRPPPRNPRPSP